VTTDDDKDFSFVFSWWGLLQHSAVKRYLKKEEGPSFFSFFFFFLAGWLLS
jgi:hypothetical protein